MLILAALLAPLTAPLAPNVDWTVPKRYKGMVVLNRAKKYSKKQISLTFDDGPDPAITPRVLDDLKKYDIKATFFVLGPLAKRHPELLRRMVLEGHCIGNHSWTHSKARTMTQAANEIQRTNAVVWRATGEWPSVFRPPYGIRNGAYAIQAKAMGMPTILWQCIDNDSFTGNAAKMIAAIGAPESGTIVLLHDGPGRKSTADMLPALLKKLVKDGYEFATVPDLLKDYDLHLASLEKKSRAAEQIKAKSSRFALKSRNEHALGR